MNWKAIFWNALQQAMLDLLALPPFLGCRCYEISNK